MDIKVKAGDVVVMNGLPDTPKWEVLGVSGNVVELREYGTDYASQKVYDCMIHKVVNYAKWIAYNL